LTLQEFGLVTRNGRYDWQISAGVKQLPLMTNILPDSHGNEPDTLPLSVEHVENALTRKNSESEIPSPSSSSSLTLDLKPDALKPLLDDPDFLRVRKNREILRNFGVQEPKRSKLSILPHVYPELIEFHCSTSQNIALAIYRIEHGWKIKKGWTAKTANWEENSDVRAQTSPPPPIEIETSPELAETWTAVLEKLRGEVKKVNFETWIKPLKLVALVGGVYLIHAGNEVGTRWVNDNALGLIESALGAKVSVTWLGKEER
jgi:hypothetical protein